VYRVIGRNLVTVAATSFSDSPEDAKKVHEVAEQVALSASGAGGTSKIKSAKPPAVKPKVATTKPSMLPNAKLRVPPPAGWTEELTDASNGVVATYRDPQESGNLIAITVRPLPKEAAKDPKLRDALVDEIVSGEKQQFKIDGANASGQPETVKDNRFLRKTRTRYEGNGKRFTVTSRQLRIGDEVVSVSSIAVDETASAVETLADEVAVGTRALGR